MALLWGREDMRRAYSVGFLEGWVGEQRTGRDGVVRGCGGVRYGCDWDSDLVSVNLRRWCRDIDLRIYQVAIVSRSASSGTIRRLYRNPRVAHACIEALLVLDLFLMIIWSEISRALCDHGIVTLSQNAEELEGAFDYLKLQVVAELRYNFIFGDDG